MTNPIIRIHNAQTNEVIDREMSDQEYAEHLENLELANARFAAELTQQQAQSL